jgi:hypothetical protein
MSQTNPSGLTNSHYDFFARSGFDVIPEEPGHWGYAKRLSRYITDASTVRVRTIEQFGIAPPLEQIREMRVEWLATIKRRGDAIGTYGTTRERRRAEEKAQRDRAAAALKPSPKNVVAKPAQQPSLIVAKLTEAPAIRTFTPEPMKTGVEVIEACAKGFGIEMSQLIGPSRKPTLVRVRNLATAVLRARGSSLPNIGRFTGREHTTVLHSLRTFFSRDILDDRYLQAWIALAPDAAKACRTMAELDMIIERRL